MTDPLVAALPRLPDAEGADGPKWIRAVRASDTPWYPARDANRRPYGNWPVLAVAFCDIPERSLHGVAIFHPASGIEIHLYRSREKRAAALPDLLSAKKCPSTGTVDGR